MHLIRDIPARPLAYYLFAHGAGAPMDSDFMADMAQRLCTRRIATVRFEFPYMQKRRGDGKKRPPDRQASLLQHWQSLIDGWPAHKLPLWIGGKSMGGRMASLWLDQFRSSTPVAGLVCLGFPFHPPGKLDTYRGEHLAAIRTPTLIVQGTRDRLGSQAEVAQYRLSSQVAINWIAGGDHDLVPLRRSGLTVTQARDQAADAVAEFIRQRS